MLDSKDPPDKLDNSSTRRESQHPVHKVPPTRQWRRSESAPVRLHRWRQLRPVQFWVHHSLVIDPNRDRGIQDILTLRLDVALEEVKGFLSSETAGHDMRRHSVEQRSESRDHRDRVLCT